MARASRAAAAILALFVSACVSFPPAPDPTTPPHLAADRIIVRDGAALAFDVWRAEDPEAVVVAVHGMNDYAHAFEGLGQYLSASGITLYAYDQRGFGRSPDFGQWPGSGTLKADFVAAVAAVRAAYPGKPVYALGHSMGAGVILAAAGDQMLDVDGVILAAPGVWGGGQLPLLYRLAVNAGATFAPGKTLTGERAERQSTDNIPILREMFADPYVIKGTRLDAILGVVRIMGEAYDASDEVGGRALLLYGEKDEIIPLKSIRRAAGRLCGDVTVRAYSEGWHLLFRDLQAENVWRDVADWIRAEAPNAAGQTQGFGPAASGCVRAGVEHQRVSLNGAAPHLTGGPR